MVNIWITSLLTLYSRDDNTRIVRGHHEDGARCQHLHFNWLGMVVKVNKYDVAYLKMAEAFSETSVANRLKVGCVIVRDGQPISLGINGTPTGWFTNNCEDQDGKTAWYTKHAEVQALNKLRKSTESSVGAEMFVTHSPCKMCALDIIDAGIKRVVYQTEYRDRAGINLLKEHDIIVEQLIDNTQSIVLYLKNKLIKVY